MSNVDDVWASMREEAEKNLQTQKIRMKKRIEVTEKHSEKKGGRVKASAGQSVDDIVAAAEAKEKKEKLKAKKEMKEKKAKMQVILQTDSGAATSTNEAFNNTDAAQIAVVRATDTVKEVEAILITAKDALLKIARDVNNVGNMDDQTSRRRALTVLHKCLFQEHILSDEDYGEVFQSICKTIFKRFTDPVEKCREMAFKITQSFFQNTSDLTLTIGYFIPALMARVPPGMAFDEDMKVFIMDMEAHEAYRRGKAVDRQDKTDTTTHIVIEPSEEIRHLGCETLFILVKKLCESGAATVLHPYFHECVMYVQAQLRDPYPDLKLVACELLELFCCYDDFTAGMKFFAVALCRAIFPVMRHRHAKIRAASISALTRCMAVPDRAKMKGSGTESIMDMVGFKEENHLSVAAFYKSDIQINYLADVVQDSSVQVRMKVAQMLHIFLTELGDRYDHQTRLLPYVLDLLCDECPEVASTAMATMQKCGKQYEDEHQDEIIDRRQYGVDGDRRMNIEKPLPAPFTERPRLGMRLYVRGNCKRFINALVAELTNWVGTTRLKSANLLKMVVIFMEEYLTMEAHTILPAFIKALGFARDDNDKDLRRILLETYELCGRFIMPETYVHYILPRLSGDAKVVQFGVDTASRVTVMEFLGAMLEGSMTREIAPLFEELVGALTDSFVISQDSSKLMNAAMGVMNILLSKMVGHGKAAIEAHFLNTGRLGNLRGTVSKAFHWLAISLSNPEMKDMASSCLASLAQLDRDSNITDTVADNMKALFLLHGTTALKSLTIDFDTSADEWNDTVREQELLAHLVGGPWAILHADPAYFDDFLSFLCECVCGKRGAYEGRRNEVLCYLTELLHLAIVPLICVKYTPKEKQLMVFSALYSSQGGKECYWSGVATAYNEKHALTLLTVLRSKMPALMECFVQHDRWGKSKLLQRKRIDLLSVLLGIFPDTYVLEISENEDENGIVCSEDIANGSINASKLLEVALELPQLATTAVGVRALGVNAASILLGLLVRTFDQSSPERLVKAFSKRTAVASPQQQDMCAKMQLTAKYAFGVLTRMLDDSSDDVRLQVLYALQVAIPLIEENTSKDDDVIEVGRNTEDIDVPSSPEVNCSYRGISLRLLKELALAGTTAKLSEIEEQLEGNLRSLAILDPVQMLSFLEETEVLLPELTPAQRSFKEEKPLIREVFSGLSDHCSILQQFA